MLDYTARADGLKKFSINIKTDDVMIYYELQNMIEKMQNNHNNVKIDDNKERISKPQKAKKKLDKKIEIKLIFSINRDNHDNNGKNH